MSASSNFVVSVSTVRVGTLDAAPCIIIDGSAHEVKNIVILQPFMNGREVTI